ncbi:MAG: SAM-dependent methyltransferase [Myxococcota bacterium]|jgi:SAM-dependent methyltransferase
MSDHPTPIVSPATGSRARPRSQAHWSETHDEGMNAFNDVARRSYEVLLDALDWSAPFDAVPGAGRFLNVGVGNAVFPRLLVANSLKERRAPIPTDLLDPSLFSLNEASRNTGPPFVVQRRLQQRIEDFEPSPRYAVVWAIHSLYCVPPSAAARAVDALVAALAPGGTLLLAMPPRDSFYIQVYDAYQRHRELSEVVSFCSADELLPALRAHADLADCESLSIAYEEQTEDLGAAELYLQRCVFDETLTLEDFRQSPALGALVAAASTPRGFSFPQRVELIRARKRL